MVFNEPAPLQSPVFRWRGSFPTVASACLMVWTNHAWWNGRLFEGWFAGELWSIGRANLTHRVYPSKTASVWTGLRFLEGSASSGYLAYFAYGENSIQEDGAVLSVASAIESFRCWFESVVHHSTGPHLLLWGYVASDAVVEEDGGH